MSLNKTLLALAVALALTACSKPAEEAAAEATEAATEATEAAADATAAAADATAAAATDAAATAVSGLTIDATRLSSTGTLDGLRNCWAR